MGELKQLYGPALTLAKSPESPLDEMPEAKTVPSFPTYLVYPKPPAFSVKTSNASISCMVASENGVRYRLENRNTGSKTQWTNSSDYVRVDLLIDQWNLIELEFEEGDNRQIRNFDINNRHSSGGDYVLHWKYNPPRYGLLGGVGSQMLDFQSDRNFTPNFFAFITRNVGADVIDRMLINCAESGAINCDLFFYGNPGSPDSKRSEAAFSALTTLLSRGWTITR